MLNLLESHRAAFSIGDQDIGRVGITKQRIELLDDTPIYQKPVGSEIEAVSQIRASGRD